MLLKNLKQSSENKYPLCLLQYNYSQESLYDFYVISFTLHVILIQQQQKTSLATFQDDTFQRKQFHTYLEKFVSKIQVSPRIAVGQPSHIMS